MNQALIFVLAGLALHVVSACLLARIRTNWIFHGLALPGVVLHEICHALISMVFGQGVGRFKLYSFDRLDPTRGFVECQFKSGATRPIRQILAMIAPLIGGLVVGSFLLDAIVGDAWALASRLSNLDLGKVAVALDVGQTDLPAWGRALGGYLLASVALAWIPSSTDLRHAGKAAAVLAAAAVAVSLVLGAVPALAGFLSEAWRTDIAASATEMVMEVLAEGAAVFLLGNAAGFLAVLATTAADLAVQTIWRR